MANLSNINNKFIVTDGGNVLIGGNISGSSILQVTGNSTFTGNVGIGDSPTFKLDVLSNGSSLRLNSSDANGAYITWANNGTAKGYMGSAYHLFASPNNSNTNIAIRTVGNLGISTNDATTPTLYLTSGNVGIGTVSPNAKLEVASGQAKTVTSGVEFARFGTSNEASNYATLTGEVKGGAAAADRKWIFQTIEAGVANAGNIAFQPSGGKVGIGEDSPDATLHIKHNSDISSDFLIIEDSDSTAGSVVPKITFRSTTSTIGGIRGHDVRGLQLGGGANIQDLNINPSGDVGIGTTSPGSRLTVNKTKSGTGVENYDLIRLGLLGTGAVGDSSTIGWFSTSGTKTAGIEGISGLDNILYGELAFHVRRYTTDSYDRVMTINNRGNVGIGITNPTRQLSVISRIACVVSGTTANAAILFGDDDDDSQGQVRYNNSNDSMELRTNSTAFLIADSSQNVGIGVTSLQSWARLQVAGTAGAQTGAKQALYVTSPSTTAGEGVGMRMSAASGSHEAVGIIGVVNNASGNSGSMTFHTYNAGADIPERMRIDNVGNVGIGTTAPNDLLNLHTSSASGNIGIKLTRASQTHGFRIGVNDNHVFLWTDQAQEMAFATSNVQRMSISASGNVGIGTTSPVCKLDVKGPDTNNAIIARFYSNEGARGDFIIRNGTGTTPTTYIGTGGGSEELGIGTNNIERIRIPATGELLKGITSAAGQGTLADFNSSEMGNGYINLCRDDTATIKQIRFGKNGTEVGSISTTGSATSFNASSDYRLKEDLQDFAGLDMVSKIPVYDFKWKVDESRSYGVMAHELQKVLPQAVSGKKDNINDKGKIKPQQVDYSKIVPLLVKSIQELKAEIELLKNK